MHLSEVVSNVSERAFVQGLCLVFVKKPEISVIPLALSGDTYAVGRRPQAMPLVQERSILRLP